MENDTTASFTLVINFYII